MWYTTSSIKWYHIGHKGLRIEIMKKKANCDSLHAWELLICRTIIWNRIKAVAKAKFKQKYWTNNNMISAWDIKGLELYVP